MLKGYIPIHFKAHELVPKSVYEQFKNDAIMFIDAKILRMADLLRCYYQKPILMNNWVDGGQLQYRGLRIPECPQYTQFSPHTRGQALDFNVYGVDDEEVRKHIIDNADKIYTQITRIEANTKGWVHIDCVNTRANSIVIFNP